MVNEPGNVAKSSERMFMAFPPPSAKDGIGTRVLRPTELHITHEVRYMQKRAARREGRIVAIRELLLFATETGDAWLLDRDDHLAARIARDGVAERIHIQESKTKFAIGWKGDYRLDGPNFIYSDWESGRVVVITGYPTQQIALADPSALAEEGQ